MRKNRKLFYEFCGFEGEKQGKSEMRVLGFEPRTYGLKDRCLKNVTPANKELTKTENPVFDTSLAILLQKYPELQEIISAWPNLPEHIKAAIKALIQTEKR